MNKTKFEKFKAWAKTNREAIYGATVISAVTATYGVVYLLAYKQQKNAIAAYNQYWEEKDAWAKELKSDGKTPIALANGDFLVIPEETLIQYYTG